MTDSQFDLIIFQIERMESATTLRSLLQASDLAHLKHYHFASYMTDDEYKQMGWRIQEAYRRKYKELTQ